MFLCLFNTCPVRYNIFFLHFNFIFIYQRKCMEITTSYQYYDYHCMLQMCISCWGYYTETMDDVMVTYLTFYYFRIWNSNWNWKTLAFSNSSVNKIFFVGMLQETFYPSTTGYINVWKKVCISVSRNRQSIDKNLNIRGLSIQFK